MTKVYEKQYSSSRHHCEVCPVLDAAIEKFPQWPDDMFHALTICQEEMGELAKDVLQFHYEKHKNKSYDTIRMEALQTIAMLHRFLNSLDTNRYKFPSISQHEYGM